MNKGKTKILECMISQMKGKKPGQPPELIIVSEQGQPQVIKDKGSLRILGANIMANMTWLSHLESGKKALLPGVRRQLGALQHLGEKLLRSCRKLLASTLIISRLNYLMPIWGGTTSNLINKVQTLQNKTARWITGLNKRTRVKDLMTACDWPNIREMIEHQTAVMTWKMIHLNKPGHLKDKLNLDQNMTIDLVEPRLQFSERNLLHRGSTIWNSLPLEMRQINTVSRFKTRLRNWIKDKRSQEPD